MCCCLQVKASSEGYLQVGTYAHVDAFMRAPSCVGLTSQRSRVQCYYPVDITMQNVNVVMNGNCAASLRAGAMTHCD